MSPPSKQNFILMAEDDADDRLLAQDALAESGLPAELRFVENGEELLDYLLLRGKFSENFAAPRPRMILLDLNMPRVDGREALQRIKQEPSLKCIPVVILTTSRSDTDVERAYNLGANSYIAKPVRFDALVGVMKTLRNYWFEVVELPAAR